MIIDRELATKVLAVVDAGLVKGLGEPQPGRMCVEAAVCYAMGLPHSDQLTCVAPSLRALKIVLNDAAWSSDAARTKGLRRLAIAQLGSAGALNEIEFSKRVSELVIRVTLPAVFRLIAELPALVKHAGALNFAASECEKEGSIDAAYAAARAADAAAHAAAHAAADAAHAAAHAAADAAAHAARAADLILGVFAEGVVQVLIQMNAPGCEFLDLTAV